MEKWNERIENVKKKKGEVRGSEKKGGSETWSDEGRRREKGEGILSVV